MKKSKFIKSTLILIIGGMGTKLLGMIIRILSSRMLGKLGMGIYSLISPTFLLLITLCQAGFPTAISKLVAEERYSSRKLILGLIPISLLFNFLLMLLILFLAPILTTIFLHEERCLYPLYAMAFVLPFISISSILRGYFFGKEKMIPHVLTNFAEDLVKIVLMILFLPTFVAVRLEVGVAFFVLTNIASELTSILLFLILLPKGNHDLRDFKPQKQYLKDIFSLSVPLTSSRIIGNIGYFLEPILLTSILRKVGYANTFIVEEYGILNGFVLPLLLLPSFFTTAVSQALIPVISKNYALGNKKETKRKLKQALLFSSGIGLFFTIIIMLFPSLLLSLLYHTQDGIVYLKILAPVFFIQYLQGPISSSLQAMGKAKVSMKATMLGTFIRLFSLCVFSFCKIGLYSAIIATTASILITTIYESKNLHFYLK